MHGEPEQEQEQEEEQAPEIVSTKTRFMNFCKLSRDSIAAAADAVIEAGEGSAGWYAKSKLRQRIVWSKYKLLSEAEKITSWRCSAEKKQYRTP